MKIISHFQHILFLIFNNLIIKCQFIDNIIKLSIKGFQYINLASYSNGDLIVEICKNPYDSKRIFIGFKKNGRGFFKNLTSNQDDYYYFLEGKSQEDGI